jgi:hypothetical protein
MRVVSFVKPTNLILSYLIPYPPGQTTLSALGVLV